MTPADHAAKTRWHGLHVLADDAPHWKHDPVAIAHAACAGGAAVVQLRAKHATDRQTLAWAHAIRGLTRESGLLFVVNDRFDIALLAEADAVHLGQDDLPPARIPESVRGRLALGRSTHSLEQARAAGRTPVDYLGFGPVFDTASKLAPDTSVGLAALGEVSHALAPLPVVGIGGIDVAGVREAVRCGASGAAVISAVAGSDDPVLSVRSLVRAIEEGPLS